MSVLACNAMQNKTCRLIHDRRLVSKPAIARQVHVILMLYKKHAKLDMIREDSNVSELVSKQAKRQYTRIHSRTLIHTLRGEWEEKTSLVYGTMHSIYNDYWSRFHRSVYLNVSTPTEINIVILRFDHIICPLLQIAGKRIAYCPFTTALVQITVFRIFFFFGKGSIVHLW